MRSIAKKLPDNYMPLILSLSEERQRDIIKTLTEHLASKEEGTEQNHVAEDSDDMLDIKGKKYAIPQNIRNIIGLASSLKDTDTGKDNRLEYLLSK